MMVSVAVNRRLMTKAPEMLQFICKVVCDVHHINYLDPQRCSDTGRVKREQLCREARALIREIEGNIDMVDGREVE